MKLDKIHEVLKVFWMLFWKKLTKNTFSQPFKRYQPSKLNGWYPKINKIHQGCYLAFFTHDSNLHLVFWLKSSSCNIFWPKKSTFWIFVIFYNHLHQDLNFGQFDPLAPTPWGTPLHHPPSHLQTCLSYPTIWKNVLNHEIIIDFKNFEVEGCHIIFSSFWAIFVNFGANGVSLGNADKPKLPIFHLRIGQRVLWLTANDFFAIHLNMGHASWP